MTFGTDVHGVQRMNPYFGDPPPCANTSLTFVMLSEMYQQLLGGLS